MVSVASQLIEEVTAHAQSDSLEDAREICADGTYFPNNLSIIKKIVFIKRYTFRPLTSHKIKAEFVGFFLSCTESTAKWPITA